MFKNLEVIFVKHDKHLVAELQVRQGDTHATHLLEELYVLGAPIKYDNNFVKKIDGNIVYNLRIMYSISSVKFMS